MACSNPFTMPHLWKNKHSQNIYAFKDFVVPCGWCLNCRRDKQNYYCDRAEYEYRKRLTGSFVTFTYDDNWLLSTCIPQFPSFRTLSNGVRVPIPTLNYRHFTAFIDNIRHYIVNHPEIQGVLCQPDFSYIYCGEYGDSFETGNFHRPHFHVCFFGLDFAYCKKIIFDSWKYGFIDCLPILDGGIRYITKYLDKQTFGALAEETYDYNNIARPRVRMSKGFGKGLLTENRSDIIRNNYTYPIARGLRRPISAYWKKLITDDFRPSQTRDTSAFIFDRKVSEFKRYHPNSRLTSYDLKLTYRKQLDDFMLDLARRREARIKQQLLDRGTPVFNQEIFYRDKFGSFHYDSDYVHKLSESALRVLSDSYINKLLEVS